MLLLAFQNHYFLHLKIFLGGRGFDAPACVLASYCHNEA